MHQTAPRALAAPLVMRERSAAPSIGAFRGRRGARNASADERPPGGGSVRQESFWDADGTGEAREPMRNKLRARQAYPQRNGDEEMVPAALPLASASPRWQYALQAAVVATLLGSFQYLYAAIPVAWGSAASSEIAPQRLLRAQRWRRRTKRGQHGRSGPAVHLAPAAGGRGRGMPGCCRTRRCRRRNGPTFVTGGLTQRGPFRS